MGQSINGPIGHAISRMAIIAILDDDPEPVAVPGKRIGPRMSEGPHAKRVVTCGAIRADGIGNCNRSAFAVKKISMAINLLTGFCGSRIIRALFIQTEKGREIYVDDPIIMRWSRGKRPMEYAVSLMANIAIVLVKHGMYLMQSIIRGYVMAYQALV
jgi:hypothetical protein